MTIVKLEKVTLYGTASQRDEVLDRLQRLGCLHLIDLKVKGNLKQPEHPHRGVVGEALKYLNASPVQNQNQHHHYTHGTDSVSIAKRALEIKERRQKLNDERDYLVRAIQTLTPWGSFKKPSAEELGGLNLWFYPVRSRMMDQLRQSDLAWRAVGEDNQYHYIVIVSAEEPQGVPGSRVELDNTPLADLTDRLEKVDEELESLHWERVALTRWTKLLTRDLAEDDDEVERMEALNRLVDDDHLFALQGWAPLNTMDALRDFTKQERLALIVETPKEEDKPPTLLKNPEAIAGAEGAVTFYITPEYKAWDPSWVMFFSFSFFFAMIMSDAGYGFVLGGLLILMWGKLSSSESGIRFRNLLVALIVATIGYGVLLGSYFGTTPAIFRGLMITDPDGRPLMENSDLMMKVAVAIGVFHLMLANLITAWRKRHSFQSLSSVGWAAVLFCGLVLGLSSSESSYLISRMVTATGFSYTEIQRPLVAFGKWGVIGGLGAVFLFSSSRPLFSTKISDYVWRVLEGFQGLTNISKAFGDTLSYLRLFALGLASAQLAATFNNLANDTLEVPGLGILLAILILVVGHGINILLAIMGGVVHGLRLNCIEFFNWSLTEEGYPFRAFSKKAG